MATTKTAQKRSKLRQVKAVRSGSKGSNAARRKAQTTDANNRRR